MSDENKIKHLEFLQNIITRMNTNSFQLKGWAVAIVSALFALSAGTSKEIFVLIALFPTILFWFLDAYYLQIERKFRKLYNDIVNGAGDIKNFEMPIHKYKEVGFWNVVFSKTIFPFYLVISALCVGIFLLFIKEL